ncbi:hypothetical protein [Streptomyces sp. NPDC088789]|uniref:hypothetical protein n=1 Tax=Streptomyces sp. NPDC088789 TaxID=3365899 RepID=UPI003814FA96
MPAAPLAVPLHLDVLVANQAVLARDTFRWWQFNYLALSHWQSPQPPALDRSEGGPREGVHLSWTLPDALRHSPPGSSHDTYPLVPNRWLVVRTHGTTTRTLTAWVLESDCPLTPRAPLTADPEHTSLYLADPGLITDWKSSADPVRRAVTLDAAAGTVQAARLGVAFPLAEWSERAPGQRLFLTAMAPGNPLFSGYVAHHAGVFSFHDPLDKIDTGTLGYHVLGWYSDPAQDILARAGGDAAAYTALLKELDWTLPTGAPTTPATRSVYHAAAFSVDWNRTGPAPTGDPLETIRDSGELNVGVGNTPTDAFTALIKQRLGDPGAARLLQAFQHDLLPHLNEAHGDALLDRAIRGTWYGARPGGYSWTIVQNTAEDGADAPLTADEQRWLHRLNSDQTALDQALTTLHGLQHQVHELWLKQGFLSSATNTWPAPPHGITDLAAFTRQLAAELDPAKSGSAAARLIAQLNTVRGLLTRVPRPDPNTTDPQEALRKGITEFAKKNALDAGKTLKAVAAPRYWQGNNPAVIVSGVEPPRAAVRTGPLTVRPRTALLTQFTTGAGAAVGATAVSGLLTQVGALSRLPTDTAAPELLTESLLLDPGNATALATATGLPRDQIAAAMTGRDPSRWTGTLPHQPLTGWKQPWTPLFLEWSGTYTHAPLTTGTTPNWTFDGHDYRLTAAVPESATVQRTVSGISLLSPQTRTLFRDRLDSWVRQYGKDSDIARLDQLIDTTYGWRLLTQELSGFHSSLALRDPRPFRSPTTADRIGGMPLDALIGHRGDPTAPALPGASRSQVDTAPLLAGGPAQPYHGTVHGGFHFTDLKLYDTFGRTLDIIESDPSSGVFDYTNFPLEIDPALTPDRVLVPHVASVLQLPPRLLQHARLDIRLLDSHDDRVFQRDPDVNPVSGWILPNHLDDSILVFAPDGTALGEFGLHTQADGKKKGDWTPPPHTRLTLADVRTRAPRLHSVLTSPQLATEAGFLAFLATIDATLWTTDPLGNRADTHLSLLIGRPLALLRTRLRFQLDGPARDDSGWAATFDAAPPGFLTHRFAVRLGDQATRQDGVIGYFTGSDHTVFHSTAAPPATPAQDYVKVIGPVGTTTPAGNYPTLSFDPADTLELTVLADPRAAIHAHTGILPVKQYDLPQQHIENALTALEITFRAGPLLTTLTPSPAEGATAPAHAKAIAHPTPAEQNGTWSWWEPDPSGTWTGYELAKTSPTPTTGPEANTLREGRLQFVTDAGTDSPPDAGAPPRPRRAASDPTPS